MLTNNNPDTNNDVVAPSDDYTCISCRLVFANNALHREHYQTEWHQYNIKRQISGLPSISLEVFQSKVQPLQDFSADRHLKKEEDYCGECGKVFKSQNAFDNHLHSKKHKENVRRFGGNSEKQHTKKAVDPHDHCLPGTSKSDKKNEAESDDDGASSWKSVDSGNENDFDESKAIPSTSCLFCNVKYDTVEANLEHMTIHGFFIPDAEYCIDANGLLTYLGMKIGYAEICILCNKRFYTLDAIQKHMRDKQHCRFSVENEHVVEFLDFYDYSSLLTNEKDVEENVAINEGYTLVLPSGARLGHRDLDRYYKQHLPLKEDESKLTAHHSHETINVPLEKYISLGWTGATGEGAVMKARDISFMKRIASKYLIQQGMKANRLFKTEGRSFYWCM